jgi:hypothetical protein
MSGAAGERTGVYRLLRVALWTGTHALAWGLRHRVAPPAFALLKTTGRTSKPARHTVLGNGLDGDRFWVVAAHGHQSDYVRNFVRQWDAAFGRAMATTPLTVRVDVEPVGDPSR